MFKYGGWLELGRAGDLERLVLHDFDAFSGYALERYFFWKFAGTGAYTNMGGWWDRKGENEIDLVCEDEVAGRIDFYEVKKNEAVTTRRCLRRRSRRSSRRIPKSENWHIPSGGSPLETCDEGSVAFGG